MLVLQFCVDSILLGFAGMQLSVNKIYKYCLILHIVNMLVAGDCQVRFREWLGDSPAYSIPC